MFSVFFVELDRAAWKFFAPFVSNEGAMQALFIRFWPHFLFLRISRAKRKFLVGIKISVENRHAHKREKGIFTDFLFAKNT